MSNQALGTLSITVNHLDFPCFVYGMTHSSISNSFKREGSWREVECATDYVYGRNGIYITKKVQSLKSCSNQKLSDVIFHRLFSILLFTLHEAVF